MSEIDVYRAEPVHAARLTEIALASKASWGYSERFMRECRDELTVHEEDVRIVGITKEGDKITGFYMINATDRDNELSMLFVDPVYIGTGLGRVLLEAAKIDAEMRKMDSLVVDSDPNAEGFYLRMGAIKIGEVPSSSIPGRMLPRLKIDIPVRTSSV